MAGRRRFICCLTEDHLVLLDRVESFPPRESWCGHQDHTRLFPFSSLVDLLWFDFVFHVDFLIYGIVSSLIDYFLFMHFWYGIVSSLIDHFLFLYFWSLFKQDSRKGLGSWIWIKIILRNIFSRLVVIPGTPKVVKPRVCSLFLLIPLFNSRPASTWYQSKTPIPTPAVTPTQTRK